MCFQFLWELIPYCWLSYRESMFANIQPSFMEFVFEVEDLWILEISEKYSRLPEYIGC